MNAPRPRPGILHIKAHMLAAEPERADQDAVYINNNENALGPSPAAR
jgi:hypothetical protein